MEQLRTCPMCKSLMMVKSKREVNGGRSEELLVCSGCHHEKWQKLEPIIPRH